MRVCLARTSGREFFSVPDRVMLFVSGAAICLGASPVFLVQPMAAKTTLPMLGGSPSVWDASMVFFQAALRVLALLALVGYPILWTDDFSDILSVFYWE